MFPEWTETNSKQAELLDEQCGELMKPLGYRCAWQEQEKLQQTSREKPVYEGGEGESLC